MEKAAESIGAAGDMIARGSFGFATSRGYYAMFYCAQALLLEHRQSYSHHSAVIAGFGREFIKRGLLDERFHRYIREAFDDRQVADYDPIRRLSRETAERTVTRAREFLAAAEALLAQAPECPCP